MNVTGLAEIIKQHRLVREHLNTQLLQFPIIWEALLEEMPMTAMIRNLGKMSAIGMLTPGSEHEKTIVRRFKNREALKKARIHPFNVLVALTTYKNGQGDLGSLTWNPSAAIMEIAAALSLVTAATETHCDFVGFSHEMIDLPIRSDMTLPQVEYVIQQVPMGGTDCALPMVYARKKNKLYDVFVVYTDCETSNGPATPSEALQQYRQHSGIADAKLIVVAMTSNGFTIADPDDANMMDMAGFDSNGPQVMKDFIGGSIMEGRSVHTSGGVIAVSGSGVRPAYVDEENEMEVETAKPIGFSQQETGDAGGGI